tara:strand:- start:345 stop:1331 length:987 start_codon:yes stop_codon:yes gene_type:complete
MIGYFPLKCLVIIFNIFFLSYLNANSKEKYAIATLKNVEGTVKVAKEEYQKSQYAREGMLLFNGNKVITSLNSKTGILYRDGSKVRLFQNSELILNFSKENFNKKRDFNYLLTFKKGALRGRFMKGLQSTKIRTPTAIIGIKGTSFRILEKNRKTTVSLTEGKLEVSNLSSKVTLETGQWLNNFSPYTNLSKKISTLPNILSLKTKVYELDFNDAESKQVELSIQIQNSISGKAVYRSGFTVFESHYRKINLPRKILLNERGFAKILISINKPNFNDRNFFGMIKIRAYMDNEGFDDVAEGLLVLKIKKFRKKRNLLLHPDRGLINNK